MNRRLVTAALSVTAALALAIPLPACGTPTIVVNPSTQTPSPAPTVTKTETATPAPAPAPTPAQSKRDAFVKSVRESSGTSISASSLLETGDLICEALDNGATGSQVIDTAISAADGDDDATQLLAAIIASSVVFLCPEHEDAVMDVVQ